MAASRSSSDDVSDAFTDVTKTTTESDILSAPTTPPSSASSRPQSTLPEVDEPIAVEDLDTHAAAKKKKKKKNKKSGAAKAKSADSNAKSTGGPQDDDRPPVLCISRNKHWRYISSYHGPWLQLPLELLESLLILNLDPATLSATESRLPPLPSPTLGGSHSHTHSTHRNRGFASVGDHYSPDSPHGTSPNIPPPPPLPAPKPGKATPPPIDPGVFRSVAHIRRLIDEASELSVRASSGLSAAALGSLRGGSGISRDPWNPQNILGTNGLDSGGGGRNFPMSATRIHRLRMLAVQKLAAAYKADEIASSVMVMQGGSVFDDIAERVLKIDPNDVDARYVHFFHEKIPSRQLAESTTTHQLDQLIAVQPHRLEFYRTRGIVHCFRDEYALAAKDFTHVVRESRALRKAKIIHRNNNLPSEQRSKNGKKKKGKGKANGQAPPDGTSAPLPDGPTIEGPDGEPLLLHPSVLPDAPDPIELQCLFLRGAAYLQHAVHLTEEAILAIEDICKAPSVDGAELRLCYIENGRFGGVEIGNPDGPLGSKDGTKLAAYKEVLANENFRGHIHSLVKKALRDHEKFLSHFDTLEGSEEDGVARDLAQKVELAYHLCENLRPNGQLPPPPLPEIPVMFTTYHPLLVESHFSILICYLMLGDFATLVPTFSRAALLVDGLEGYPVFLPPRSMAQAEYIEILERLAGGWRNGVQPHSLTRSKHLALTAPPMSPKAKDKEVDRKVVSPTASPISPSSSTSTESALGHLSTTTIETLLGVNGSSSSSSSAAHLSRTPSPSVGHEDTPTAPTPTTSRSRADLIVALDHARMLLNPVAARQKEKTEKLALEKANAKRTGKKKPLNINIPLHGPRVEIVLAWLGAVHLVELDTVA